MFGARATGKSTLLNQHFSPQETLWLDLLDPVLEERLLLHPEDLKNLIQEAKEKKWVIVDEVQKVPKLLDVVHQLIYQKKAKFALTGSSARKLKRGAANLLAGRAFIFHLFPLTYVELGEQFNLEAVLKWGSLPEVFQLSEAGKYRYLQSYAQTYFKEEILQEQIIRKVRPFRAFLEVAAQASGTILNYSKIARDIGADAVTTQSYFQILEDTLLGFFLEPYHRSIRKRQTKAPKFYFFDLGLLHALEKSIADPKSSVVSLLGRDFEHFIILEVYRLIHYQEKNWTLSYLCTKDETEIDLIIERPGMPLAVIEIKSTKHIEKVDLGNFLKLSKDFGKNSECYVFSRDPLKKRIDHVHCLPWEEGFKALSLF